METATNLPANWQERPAYLFISLKNRAFTRTFIAWFVDACQTHFSDGQICIVDEPYHFNRQAELGITGRLPAEEVAKLEQLAWEINRKVSKVISFRGNHKVSVIDWHMLSATTPAWMKAEIQAAFERKGDFYEKVLKQVLLMKGNQRPIADLERFAGFFLCELPVLLHVYYSSQVGIVDIYPGNQAQILWQIEAGDFREELPVITRQILAGPKLVYLDASGEM